LVSAACPGRRSPRHRGGWLAHRPPEPAQPRPRFPGHPAGRARHSDLAVLDALAAGWNQRAGGVATTRGPKAPQSGRSAP